MSTPMHLFTSESVSPGHPDKIADQISDGLLDAILAQDPGARVAIEVLIKTGMVIVAGELTTDAWVDIEATVRSIIEKIGYVDSSLGFDAQSCAVLTAIGKQSADIAMGVTHQTLKDQGAGDQGIMFGFACDDTDVLMPAPVYYAHQLMRKHGELRDSGVLSWLRPDAKAQVTFAYKNGLPVQINDVVLSTQHAPEISHQDLQQQILDKLIKAVLPAKFLHKETRYHINPTGRFVVGGPLGDCGLTGRKIIVDTYGGFARHGGGAFSGKDPSKVDRSGAYMARYIAKNIVAAGLARRCEVQLAYAIGEPEPTCVNVETFGSSEYDSTDLSAIVSKYFDLSPWGITTTLDLLRPIYQPTATYGHFGRIPNREGEGLFPWEELNQVETLRAVAAKVLKKKNKSAQGVSSFQPELLMSEQEI